MKQLRQSSREEVVSYYIISELKRLVESADKQPTLESKVVDALKSEPCDAKEGTLHHMSRSLLGEWRGHSWLHERFWSDPPLVWSLVEVQPDEINVLPIGGKPEEFHYPKLNALVEELRVADSRGERVPGIHEDAKSLLFYRDASELQERKLLDRIIAIKGTYADRHFDCIIGDGFHRAVSMTANNRLPILAYYGRP